MKLEGDPADVDDLGGRPARHRRCHRLRRPRNTMWIWHTTGHPAGDPLSLVEPCRALALTAQRLILATGNAVALLESTETR